MNNNTYILGNIYHNAIRYFKKNNSLNFNVGLSSNVIVIKYDGE